MKESTQHGQLLKKHKKTLLIKGLVMTNFTQGVGCKCEIILKSVVTKNFMIDLALELKQSIESLKSQFDQIAEILKQEKGKGNDLTPLENEQKKIAAQLKVLQDRLEKVPKLKEGDYYTTGKIEGYSQMKIGEDIREKLGSIEVISRDYIVQEINVVSKEHEKKKSANK